MSRAHLIMFVSAIVPAAGCGLRLTPARLEKDFLTGPVRNTTLAKRRTKISKRVSTPLPKPLINLDKQPILVHTLKILTRHPDIKEIILVVSSDSLNSIAGLLKKYRIRKIKELVIGGRRRRDSVQNGLNWVSPQAELILIHDAVRPFIELDMISRVIQEAEKSGAAILGVPIKPTVKEIDTGNRVIKTLRRERLYEIQTPQVFQRDLILNAYRKFPNLAAVDDASLVERLGNQVAMVSGSYFNIKITTPEDLVFAQAILRAKKT